MDHYILNQRTKRGPRDHTDEEYMCISTHQYISPADILGYVVSLSSFYEMRIKRPYINYLIYNAWTIISSITAYLSIGKYGRGLTYIRCNVLHWLDVTDRVRFTVCVQVFKCLRGMAPDYLSTMYHPVSRLPWTPEPSLCESRTARRPSVTLWSCGVPAFAHAGPSLWNTLPVHLNNRSLTLTTFMRHLKSLFSVLISYRERVWGVIT